MRPSGQFPGDPGPAPPSHVAVGPTLFRGLAAPPAPPLSPRLGSSSPPLPPPGPAPPLLAPTSHGLSHPTPPPLTRGASASAAASSSYCCPPPADPSVSQTLTLAARLLGTLLSPEIPSDSLDAPAPMASPTAAAEKPDEGVEIRDVWAGNLEAEFALIRDVVDDYRYVAMDTEFPGIVCRPLGSFRTNDEYNYATLKANVDMLKLLQLGLTLSDESGALPARGTGGRACSWQFNFRGFDPRSDPGNADSIDMLRKSGINFDHFAAEGIDAGRFAELLMSSGILFNADLQWVTFHSGYDFGYLLRLLTGQNLPDTMPGFFDLIRIYFPVLYDIKHLMRYCGSLHGGLSKLAELLSVERVGTCHQAGSDSLVTLRCYKKLKEAYFKGSTEKYAGVLYGLATDGGENRPPPTPLIE